MHTRGVAAPPFPVIEPSLLRCSPQENARHRLLCESLVDEARGIVIPPQDAAVAPAGAGAGGRAGTLTGEAGEASEDVGKDSAVVLSALRLEQMSKAVRAIVHDLQHSVAQQRQQELREGPAPGPSPSPAATQTGGGWARDVAREPLQQHQLQQLANTGEQPVEAKREPGT